LKDGPESKVLREYGYFYRNKAGNSVYHGPWYSFYDFEKGQKWQESIYVHGVFKCMQEWNPKGLQTQAEIYKSDDNHTMKVSDYYTDGSPSFHGQYIKVRYIRTKTGHRIDRVPDGPHFHYYENYMIRQEELYRNGQQTGIAIYDRTGKKVLGRGTLGY